MTRARLGQAGRTDLVRQRLTNPRCRAQAPPDLPRKSHMTEYSQPARVAIVGAETIADGYQTGEH
ncbi:hypothetical protein, partial [Streptomyces resistomycificus]|uniref:hypothetical protein n=1 Tax=Streptomyces resistomycificus TaxID=67356 RepID=UPI001ADEC990